MLPNTSDSRLPQIVPGPGARGNSGTMATVYGNDIVLGGSNRIQNQRLPTVSPIVSRILVSISHHLIKSCFIILSLNLWSDIFVCN